MNTSLQPLPPARGNPRQPSLVLFYAYREPAWTAAEHSRALKTFIKLCEEHDLKGQWRYWFEREMAWLDADRVPIYHTTSNHNTLNAAAEDVWREVLPDIPDNGPPGQEGLSYWVRRDYLLLVVVNTSYSGLGGPGHVESDWLHSVLSAHRDARHKIVAGHHPALPVNGYDERPQWCIARSEAESFWQTLVRHGVLAYFC